MYSIFRCESALTPLRETYENSDETMRLAILQASSQLDKFLVADPHSAGESREGQTRILFASPVGIEFEVDEERNLVCITRSWAFRVADEPADCD
jgi:hypothetical protein